MSEPSDPVESGATVQSEVESGPTVQSEVESGPTVQSEVGTEATEEEAPAGAHFQRFDLRTQRAEAMAAAQAAIRAGQAIVLPTDTVYGIGADAFSAEAVAGLLDAKRRGRDMPPPVLIAEPAMLPALVSYVPMYAEELAKRFWPGALTLILTAQSALRMDLGETGGTIAVRVPDNQDARDLLRHTGPLAVSSANVTGLPPATNVEEAIEQLGDSVAVYLDGGQTPGNIPSTIVDFSVHGTGRLVRRGVITFEALHEQAPYLEDVPQPAREPDLAARPGDQLAQPTGQPRADSGLSTGSSGSQDAATPSPGDSGIGQPATPSQPDLSASENTTADSAHLGDRVETDPDNQVEDQGTGDDPLGPQG